MKKKILLIMLALSVSSGSISFASESETDMSYEELMEEYEELKEEKQKIANDYAALLLFGNNSQETVDNDYNDLKEKYDALEAMYNDAILRIQELEDANSDIPVYDITGTIDEVTNTTFTVTTSKGNTYTFSKGTEEINFGEKVSFSYKGEIASGAKVQSGTVRNLIVTESAPVVDENNISVSYSVGSYNGSGWEDALICTFKNNSGADLFIEVSATFYDSFGNWCASTGDFHNCFKNGEDLVMIFDYIEFDSYDVDYTVYQTQQKENNLYEKTLLSTNRGSDDCVYFTLSNNVNLGFNFDSLIIYYDENGNIVDYNRQSWGLSDESGGIDWMYDSPIAKDMSVADYSDYKVYYRIYQY